MGMLYSVVFAGVAVTAQQDLISILAPADCICVIHSVALSQSTEVGDAQEEGLSILFKRGATSAGSGGGTFTPSPLEFGFAAAGSTARINDTSKASGGTIVTMIADNWNVRSPYLWLPTPETRLVLSPSQRLTVELATTPADSITMSATLVYEEVGG